jgi:hypothetical protein
MYLEEELNIKVEIGAMFLIGPACSYINYKIISSNKSDIFKLIYCILCFIISFFICKVFRFIP